MKNSVMNYNQFMSVFKSAASGYSGKGNVANKDAKSAAGINQGMVTGPISGKNTAHLDKFTKQHLANIKKKSASMGSKKK
jgi:hypothetical protein